MDGELGGIFIQSTATPWNQYGAYVGVASSYSASFFDPAAIKVNYTRFHVHKPSDDTSWTYFPFTALKNYEAQEVAAGRPPIFITATYQGKKRPVLWAWSLGLSGNVPTRPQQNWEYAVNVGDERYIRFWLNRYLRPMMWQGMYDVPNLWWGLDESAFLSALYGVLDDNNQFVAGVPWDAPFPQGNSAYSASVATFFNRVKALAPDVRLMPNLGSMNDPNQISTIFADVPGLAQEGYYEINPSTYTRNDWIPYFNGISWFGAQGRMMVMRAMIPPSDAVQNAYAVYQLLKGPNFFFAPMYAGTGTAMPPAQYARMEADLGSPLSPFKSQQEPGMSIGYRLFWRMFGGGIVYVNWTGKTKTIVLPTDRAYFNASGSRVQQITMQDSTGTYVSTTATAKAARPEISPRLALPTNGPLSILLKSDTPGANIYYTLDGSTPTTASTPYVGPFSLSNSATVKAIATAPFLSRSTVGSATYTINGTLPRVRFTAGSDSGPGGPFYPVLSLDKVPNPSAPVKVDYSVTQPSGSTTSGSVTFLPGETYRYFPVTAGGASNTITRVAITRLTNAIYGTTTQFIYTVN